MASDAVSDGPTFFGLSSGLDTGAPGTSGQGVADPSSAVTTSNLYGASNSLTTGAENVGDSSPVDVSANDDGGPASATDPFGYLSGSNSPLKNGTSATSNGSPNGALPAGNTVDNTGSGSGSVTHYGNGRRN